MRKWRIGLQAYPGLRLLKDVLPSDRLHQMGRHVRVVDHVLTEVVCAVTDTFTRLKTQTDADTNLPAYTSTRRKEHKGTKLQNV